MAPDEFNDVTDIGVLERSNQNFRKIKPEVYQTNLHRALGIDEPQPSADPATSEVRFVWPKVKVVVVWCDMGMGDCVWAAVKIREKIDEFEQTLGKDGGKRPRRKVEFRKLAGANHFAHWDDPELVVRSLAGWA